MEGLRKGKNEFLEASRIFKPTPTLIGEMNEAMVRVMPAVTVTKS